MKRGKYEDIITDIQNDKTIGTKVVRVGYCAYLKRKRSKETLYNVTQR